MEQGADWRLQGQEKYLSEKKLILKNYSERQTKTDHDHCKFCGEKFSDSPAGSLTRGYTTEDDYHWICEECFRSFSEKFRWNISE